MSRNYFDANDSRNFCSLTKEAKKYSPNNANALRDHYESKGVILGYAIIAIGLAIPKIVKFASYAFATPKYEKIVRGDV